MTNLIIILSDDLSPEQTWQPLRANWLHLRRCLCHVFAKNTRPIFETFARSPIFIETEQLFREVWETRKIGSCQLIRFVSSCQARNRRVILSVIKFLISNFKFKINRQNSRSSMLNSRSNDRVLSFVSTLSFLLKKNLISLLIIRKPLSRIVDSCPRSFREKTWSTTSYVQC